MTPLPMAPAIFCGKLIGLASVTRVKVDEIPPLDFAVFDAVSDRLGRQRDASLGSARDPMTSGDPLVDADLRRWDLVQVPGG